MDEVAVEFASMLRKSFNVQSVMLFGSRARGDNLASSDYDFIIISKDFEKMDFVDRIKEVFKRTGAFINADVLCYTPSEFNRKKSQVGTVRSAAKEAIAL